MSRLKTKFFRLPNIYGLFEDLFEIPVAFLPIHDD